MVQNGFVQKRARLFIFMAWLGSMALFTVNEGYTKFDEKNPYFS